MGCFVSTSKRACKEAPGAAMIRYAAAGRTASVLSLIDSKTNVDFRDRLGRTALHLASAEGHLETVRELLDRGANFMIRDRMNSEPIHEAIRHGHPVVREFLISKGATLDSEDEAELEMSLIFCVHSGNLSEVKSMIEGGVSPCITDFAGKTLLQLATDAGHAEIARYLVERGVKYEANDLNNSLLLTSIRAPPTSHSEINAGTDVPSIKSRMAKVNKMASFTIMQACSHPIAIAMLEGRPAEPIYSSNATLFYCDIVGFTTLSSSLPPDKVSRMLHTFFTRLDRLAYQHGVQKVDVAGDAYIAATNFSERQPDDHAARMARFALDAVEVSKAVVPDDADPAARPIEIRVGLHCGAVSGIVADRRGRRYTLLGDAVRVAARMESSGEAGRVHCSAAAARLVAQQASDLMLTRRERSAPPSPSGGGGGGDDDADAPHGPPGDGGAGGQEATYWATRKTYGWRSFGSCSQLGGQPAGPRLSRPRCTAFDDDADLAALAASGGSRRSASGGGGGGGGGLPCAGSFKGPRGAGGFGRSFS